MDGFALHTVGVEHVSLHQNGFSLTWNSVSAKLGWDLRDVVLRAIE